MSHKNGNRSRFDRQKLGKLRMRTKMRAIRKSIKVAKTGKSG